MSPNPLDVQTIHASQNDGESRQWEFELHNNGELIDTSEVTEQMFFKAYKGGKEQLLPENASTPTTSPFLGDIKYPQGLLTDQEFTYRQSPTEEDGLAKITDIKGNTLGWNQLVQNGNFESTNGWSFNNPSSASVSSNTLTVSANTDASMGFPLSRSMASTQGHKYLIMCDVQCSQANQIRVRYPFVSSAKSISANTWTRFAEIGTATSGQTLVGIQENGINGATYNYKNFVCFDLTQMGLGSITSVDEFKALFPLPFYQFEQGKLLSFNGNGIKTVSKNQFNTQIVSPSTTVGTTLTKGDGSIRLQYTGTGRYTGFNFMNPNGGLVSDWANELLLKKKYRLSFDFGGAEVAWTCGLRTASANSFVGSITMQNQGHYFLTLDLDTVTEDVYISWARTGNSTNPFDVTVSNIQLELGTTETSYTPFEERTISLPISQYFPTGMKSAGNVYDELTESKAITRVGSRAYQSGDESDTSVITDGTTTYYALATPTETSFTTASLVTENAEIPLSNEDGTLIGKCTEELSAEPGFHDAKIKLSDSDGTCYSNKLQLHVERSPQ